MKWIPSPSPQEVLLELPLFAPINPLERPRLNFLSKHIYQPLENQEALLAELALYGNQYIDEPVFIETLISHAVELPHTGHVTHKKFGDLDNQAKAIHDALVKAKILNDDNLVVSFAISRAYGPSDFCLVRIWSVAPHLEGCPWDSATALTKLQRPRPAPPPSPGKTRPSKSSRRAAAKPKS